MFVCLCSCDMSGINGYYHYDNANYSQPIKPEECQFIHLADAVVCVCVFVCVSLSICASSICYTVRISEILLLLTDISI